MARRIEDDEPELTSDYKVGYRKPPVSGQFKPGVSGNPKGRKAKPTSVQAQAQKALSKKVRVTDGGKSKLLSFLEVIIRCLVTKAAKGDLKAAAFLFNLANSPLYADTDTISDDTLSPEDMAMLEKMMDQYLDTDVSAQLVDTELADEPVTEGNIVQSEHSGLKPEQNGDDSDV